MLTYMTPYAESYTFFTFKPAVGFESGQDFDIFLEVRDIQFDPISRAHEGRASAGSFRSGCRDVLV